METRMSVIWIFVTYVIGSVPFGLLIARTFCGIDPRTAGSGNVGSTNVARLCGQKWGVLTLLCDILKGAVPVFISLYLTDNALIHTLTALAAIFGHLFSCFLKFKGGKAVATSIGVFISLSFWQLFVAAMICILLIWRSGFVSLGSLGLVTSLPIILIISGRLELLPLSLIVMCLVYWSHRDNIKRLARGEEKTWIKSKTKL